MGHVLAVDLGGTKTSIAVVDDLGHILKKQKLPATSAFESTIEQIVTGVKHWKEDSLVGAGVIVPGIYDSNTGHAWAPNLWGNDSHPLRGRLQEHLDIPIEIGSDRIASAIAEEWLGVARGLKHIVFVAVGTGIGVGIISNGQPLEGSHGIAGAAGWMLVGGHWKPEYTRCGAWESEAAGPALARRAGKQTAEQVIEGARTGDDRCSSAVRQTAEYLAMGIGALIAILDPQIVVLGGGVMQAGDLMLDQIRRNALAWTQPIAAKYVRIEKTALGEDAGLLGAARLACLKTKL